MPCYRDSQQLDKDIVPKLLPSVAGHCCFQYKETLLVQRGPDRHARGASHPGCGTRHPRRFACVLLAAAPTTTPCFRHWRRSSSLPLPRGASGEEGKFSGMPKPPLVRSNNDDRRQRRKQGVAVGAAASRMQATAQQTLGAATRAVASRQR